MNKIINSIDLSALLERLIKDLKNTWKDPFKSPILIFPNSKFEQWFKYNWLKQTTNGILMNLEYARMESFLYQCVARNSKSLSKELIRDILIAKLEDKDYINSLESFNSSYLKDENKINEVRLFDFASQMAELFVDYEVDMLNWNDVNSSNKEWEKKLYDDILKEGVKLEFTSQEGRSKQIVEYKTLLEAYNSNKEFELPDKFKDRDVFVFGFSGMGKVHREILKKIANSSNVTIYLQYDANAEVPNKDWTINGNVEYAEWVVGEKDEECVSSNVSLPQYTLVSAPSKLREVEVLHSAICKLINDNGVKPSDILVVAPNISDYVAEIDHIFEHDAKVNMPYVLADGSSKHSLVSSAFDVLMGMLQKKGLTRVDIFKLLHNPVVQKTRGISEEEVSGWLTWVESMNVFRSNDTIDDWGKAKCRLLTARLTNEIFTVNGAMYLPYEDMDSQSNSSLSKFISVVDDAKHWCEFANKERIGNSDIEDIENRLSSFLKMEGQLDEDLEGEIFVYANIRRALHQQLMLLNSGIQKSLSFCCFMFALKESIQEVTVVKGLAYIDGMTFTSMKPNRVMTADYVFMLGMDSKSFPGVQKLNVLDIRNAKEEAKQLPAQNRNTFLCQLMATGKELHISYVSRDLRKDDFFYPAAVILDLKINEANINIDETREKSNLFTSRSRRNKQVYDKLNGITTEGEQTIEEIEIMSETNDTNANASAPDRVTLFNLQSFLEDPFEAYVNRMLGTDGEEDAETENTEFEPIGLDNKLLESRIRKEYVKKRLVDDGNIDDYKQGLERKLLTEGYLRDGEQAHAIVEKIASEGDKLFDSIKDIGLKNFDDNIELYLTSNSKAWLLSGTMAWHVWKSNTVLHIVEISSKQNFMIAYVTALAAIVHENQIPSCVIDVTLYSLKYDSKHNEAMLISKDFQIESIDAKTILEQMYKRAFIDNYHKCVLIKDIIGEYKKKSLGDFRRNLLDSYGSWEYFEHKKLININRDLGYNKADFSKRYEAAINEQKKLICFITSEKN